MRVAVYGGSFHPPHVGHAMVAAWVRWTDQADAVWLVPTYDHPFGKDLAPFATRVAWCEAMAADVGDFVHVSDIEARLEGTSWTVRTLQALADAHPEHSFRLLLGADAWASRDAWRDWATIERDFVPLVVGRPGHPPIPGAPVFPDVSSTQVRALLAAGEPVDGLVTASVARQLAAPSG